MLFVAAATAVSDGAAPVSYDAGKHRVTFSIVSTDCGLDAQLEFLFVGPTSDRDYESMFVTEASVQAIADAFDKAGFPRGVPIDVRTCRFWPVGNAVEMEPSFTNLVREMRGEPLPKVIYTGGLRDAAGVPEAQTNMPSAVFALYNCGQSLITLNDTLEQSVTYGRFQPAIKIPKGEKRSVTFTWKGNTDTAPLMLGLRPGNLAEAMATLREKSATAELDVRTDFAPELTVKEAGACAQALALLDSTRIKLNGFREGQLFYRAFLPLEKWRDRKERLAQPPEVHFKTDGSVLVNEIIEDWSGDEETIEPKLSVREHPCADLAAAAQLCDTLSARTQTIFVFTSPETKLADIYAFRKGMANPPLNWYVFTE
ncbi:MAG: hypothetical protein ACI4R9_09415 [Kiritimatiellia bacterium]